MNRFLSFSAIVVMTVALTCGPAAAESRVDVSIDPPFVQANMGDRITFVGTITNHSDQAVSNVIVYISLANVTEGKEAPLDLEDWSANKAVVVESVPPNGAYEGQWPVRLIDSGSYVAYITVVDKNSNIPVSSAMSRLEVKRVLRLNPGNVLPVALGEPVTIGIIFLLVGIWRRRRIG
jgi:hypothetical protein